MTASSTPSGEPPRPVVAGLRALHLVGCGLIVFVMLWIGVDVAGRGLFGSPLPDSHELVAYALPIAVFLQVPYVLAIDGHLLSPLLVDRSPPVVREALLVLRDVLGAAFTLVAAWASLPPALRALESGRYYGHAGVLWLPVGPARLTVTAGLLLLAILFVWRLASRVRRWPGGRHEPAAP